MIEWSGMGHRLAQVVSTPSYQEFGLAPSAFRCRLASLKLTSEKALHMDIHRLLKEGGLRFVSLLKLEMGGIETTNY